MGRLNVAATRLATLLVLHAAGAGMASPTVLISKPVARMAAEWLPTDNQTVYRLAAGERRSLELNTSSIKQATVFITVSPCTRDFHWALYYGKAGNSNGHLTLKKEDNSGEMSVFSLVISQNDKYVLQLRSVNGGAGAVSVRAEKTRGTRLRLRTRSRRRLAASWDQSPIDPQETTYCVVASHKRNYTSLCAAQHDLNLNRFQKFNKMIDSDRSRYDISSSTEVDNQINLDSNSFSLYEGNLRSIFKRKKIGRSTKVTDEDPVIACVGDRTHHIIENLDPTKTYFVSVFGIAHDRRSGSLLATGNVRARTSTAKRLKENVPLRTDVKGKTVYYYKASVSSSGGAWFTVTTCGGAVDVEVLVKGKRLYAAKNVDPHLKFFVPAPRVSSSMQEMSDEGSTQFDSSSEEAKVRFVLKIVPTRWNRPAGVNVEVVASAGRWGAGSPELCAEGALPRELRARRACKEVHLAFLPAHHLHSRYIRYCVVAREMNEDHNTCTRPTARSQCVDHVQTQPPKVIIQKIVGLKAGRKYAIQVFASNNGSSVPYNILYVDTNVSCRDD